MNKEEIEEMLFKLKRQNTFKDIGYFKTALSNEDVDLLLNYINQLENNWKELKKWLEEEIKQYDNVGLKFKKQSNFECASRSYDYLKQYQSMLSKMQEIYEILKDSDVDGKEN